MIAFRRQYGVTALVQRAWAQLRGLEMKKDDVDQYIAEFKNLMLLAGKQWSDSMSANYSRSSLKVGLQSAILNQHPVPQTLDEWQAMAHKEVEVAMMKKASLGERPKYWMLSHNSLWQDTPNTQPKQKKPRDPNTMDIDAVCTSNMSSGEHQSLMKEGRCHHQK